jgi:hypothetical protein
MMIIEDQEHLDKVREFARSVGAEAELQKQLDFLAGFGGDAAKVRCHLNRDFTPHSFFCRMGHSLSAGWKAGLIGGLISAQAHRATVPRPRSALAWPAAASICGPSTPEQKNLAHW